MADYILFSALFGKRFSVFLQYFDAVFDLF